MNRRSGLQKTIKSIRGSLQERILVTSRMCQFFHQAMRKRAGSCRIDDRKGIIFLGFLNTQDICQEEMAWAVEEIVNCRGRKSFIAGIGASCFGKINAVKLDLLALNVGMANGVVIRYL